jgi:hypothetical protein
MTLAIIDHHAEPSKNSTWRGSWPSQNALCRVRQTCGCWLDYKQRPQQLFFPEGIALDRNRFDRTAATALSTPSECADERMASRRGIEPTAADALPMGLLPSSLVEK